MNDRKPLQRSLTALATAALGVAAIATSAQAHDETEAEAQHQADRAPMAHDGRR